MPASNVVAYLAQIFPNGTGNNLTAKEKKIADSFVAILQEMDIEDGAEYIEKLNTNPTNAGQNQQNGARNDNDKGQRPGNHLYLDQRMPPHYPSYFNPSTSRNQRMDYQMGWMYQLDYHHRPNQRNIQDFTKDSPGGRYYVNLNGSHNQERQKRRGNNNPKQTKLALPKVKEIPPGMTTIDLKIDPSNVICFAGKDHYLSNMFPAPIEIDGHCYTSVEHYYQCTKVYVMVGPEKAAELIAVKDATVAKNLAHKLVKSVEKARLETWKLKDAPKILDVAIRHKFEQNAELKKEFLETKDALLVHAYDRENIYATGCRTEEVKNWANNNENVIYKIPVPCTDPKSIDCISLIGSGRNLLGALLMIIRKDLASGTPSNSTELASTCSAR